ncbi:MULTISPECIES: hypothetical protein [unclassified Limnobacter]|uniref:hypothetical protein n=1 Tax=unclassified Limnobacter TaxID=2630203 RepID=UPI0039C9EFC3
MRFSQALKSVRPAPGHFKPSTSLRDKPNGMSMAATNPNCSSGPAARSNFPNACGPSFSKVSNSPNVVSDISSSTASTAPCQ